MRLNSSLYVGQVYHKRQRPREHVLRYSVFSLLLDLEKIDSLVSTMWLFSRNRFNVFGFCDRDFGERAEETLVCYVNRKLVESGIDTVPAQIMLSCYPRVLGYAFNPLSVFYCLDEKGHCFAVVHEVHNTFGERHAYTLPVGPVTGNDTPAKITLEPSSGNEHWIRQNTDKQLFVSPFAHMGMHYDFRLNLPGRKQFVVIRASDENGLLITASYAARQCALNTTELAKIFFKIPLMSLKVTAGIHWEALRLWIKGVPLFKHQPKRTT